MTRPARPRHRTRSYREPPVMTEWHRKRNCTHVATRDQAFAILTGAMRALMDSLDELDGVPLVRQGRNLDMDKAGDAVIRFARKAAQAWLALEGPA